MFNHCPPGVMRGATVGYASEGNGDLETPGAMGMVGVRLNRDPTPEAAGAAGPGGAAARDAGTAPDADAGERRCRRGGACARRRRRLRGVATGRLGTDGASRGGRCPGVERQKELTAFRGQPEPLHPDLFHGKALEGIPTLDFPTLSFVSDLSHDDAERRIAQHEHTSSV